MKNLIFLSAVALLCSCGTVNEETEVIITDTTVVDTTVVDTTVVDTTVVNTFDPSGISNVDELLDTLSNMESGTIIEE